MDNYQQNACEALWRNYNGLGRIKVFASTDGGVFPLPGAGVRLFIYSYGQLCLLSESTTDISGISEFNELPALPKEDSQVPSADYAGLTYNVEINHPALGNQRAAIPVFDRVKTVWKVSPLITFILPVESR